MLLIDGLALYKWPFSKTTEFYFIHIYMNACLVLFKVDLHTIRTK